MEEPPSLIEGDSVRESAAAAADDDVVSCRALKARGELVSFFQAGVNEVRQQLAAGQAVPGVLARLVAAVDEEGNRYRAEQLLGCQFTFLQCTYCTTTIDCNSAFHAHRNVAIARGCQRAVCQGALLHVTAAPRALQEPQGGICFMLVGGVAVGDIAICYSC